MVEFHPNLSEEEIRAIVSFLGYGRPSAPVWFIGLEEGLGHMDSDDAIRNLKARGKFGRVMDLYDAHLDLEEKGRPINIENKPPSTQVWRWMAKIMLAVEGLDWRDRNLAKDYVRFRLGRADGDTFMTELSPIPAGNAKDEVWRTLFKDLDPGLDSKINERRCELKKLLKENAPPLVICYGRTRADAFAELLDLYQWGHVSSGVSASPDLRCLLLPFFGLGQMSQLVIQVLLDKQLLSSRRADLYQSGLSLSKSSLHHPSGV